MKTFGINMSTSGSSGLEPRLIGAFLYKIFGEKYD